MAYMLIKRGGRYSFRRSVPVELREIVGALLGKPSGRIREIVRRLDTSDLQVAKSRALVMGQEIDALIWRARRTLQNPEAAVAAVASNIVREDADWRRGRLLDDDERDLEIDVIGDELERLSEQPKSANLTDEVQRQARIKALRTILARLESPNGAAHAAEPEEVTLSGLFERYKAERKPSKKVWREFDLVCRHAITVFGDLDVRSITKSHIRSFKAALLTMPTSKRRQGQQDGATLSTSTVVKLLSLLRSVLAWGEREGFMDINPAHGTARVASTEKKAATADDEKKRRPFTVEEVRDLLSKLPPDGPTRWLLLLLAYTGARLAEVVGLRQQDIGEQDGVTYLDIRPHESRSLKTKASRRRVPIHNELLRMGFTRDMLPFAGAADIWSQKLGRWLRTNGFADARLVIHSFRHTVKDRLRAARVPEAEQRALLGHAGSGAADSYGSGFPLSVLKDAVNKITY
jgi:integrase